jgi:hypothetical protein
MTSEQEHTVASSTGMSVFSMLAAPSAGFLSPETGRANFPPQCTSSPRRQGAMTRSLTGSATASPSDSDVPKKREREEVDRKPAMRELKMGPVQGDRGRKKAIGDRGRKKAPPRPWEEEGTSPSVLLCPPLPVPVYRGFCS